MKVVTMEHKEKEYCVNESRITKLETKVEEHTEDIDDLAEENKEIKKTHHRDFVSFRNQMNELQGELISINASIKTLISVVSVIGILVAILEVISRFPPFH